MGKQSAAPPAQVDYNQQAQSQGAANIDAMRVGAQQNRVNQYTPYGSMVYTPTSNPDQWDSTVSLSPDQQSLLDKQTQGEQTLADTANSGLGRVQDAFSKPFDTSGMPARVTSVNQPSYDMYNGSTSLPNSTVDTSGVPGRTSAGYQSNLDFSSLGALPTADQYGAQSKDVQDALYRKSTAVLDPQYKQMEDQERTRLINAGVAEGSEAFSNAMNAFSQQRQSDYGDARDRSIIGGGAEQSRLLNDSLAARNQGLSQIISGGQFANTAADQANAYGLADRQQNLTELYDKAQFENAAGQQGIDNQLKAAGFNNTTKQQGYADAITGGNFQNQARGASMDEQAYLRSLPLNEYNALVSGTQVTNPQFGNTPGVNSPAPAPVFAGAQAQNQSAIDLYNQQVAQGNSNTQGLVSLIGTGATIF
jgi:hypothetical protein